MDAAERRFFDTYIRPHQNGPGLKLMLLFALEGSPKGETMDLSYRDMAERAGLNRHTLIHALKRLRGLRVDGVPIVERNQKGQGRKSSSYSVHLPRLRVAGK